MLLVYVPFPYGTLENVGTAVAAAEEDTAALAVWIEDHIRIQG